MNNHSKLLTNCEFIVNSQLEINIRVWELSKSSLNTIYQIQTLQYLPRNLYRNQIPEFFGHVTLIVAQSSQQFANRTDYCNTLIPFQWKMRSLAGVIHMRACNIYKFRKYQRPKGSKLVYIQLLDTYLLDTAGAWTGKLQTALQPREPALPARRVFA